MNQTSGFPISVEINGKAYNGQYTFAGGVVTVSTFHGQTSKRIGHASSVAAFAGQVLREFIRSTAAA
jgi:hypothetical protein